MVETTDQPHALDLNAMHARIAFTRAEVARLCFGPDAGPTERDRVKRWGRDRRLSQLAVRTPGSASRVSLTLRGDYEAFTNPPPDPGDPNPPPNGVDTVRTWQRQGGRLVTVAELHAATGLSRRFWQQLAKVGAAHGGLDTTRADGRGLLYFRRDDVADWLLRMRPAARGEA